MLRIIIHISGSENVVAEVLSRIEAINIPSPINYEKLAEA